ncbi:tRNA (uracil-5-)-methyltransferase homolog B-like [Lycorma delicatula]|uniref:tRNA (uracil-5-)-methyltransferase homolog B-like n=1 Tax=Lycorma delicatula TaxID=130591 RepID=UPI003F50D6F9
MVTEMENGGQMKQENTATEAAENDVPMEVKEEIDNSTEKMEVKESEETPEKPPVKQEPKSNERRSRGGGEKRSSYYHNSSDGSNNLYRVKVSGLPRFYATSDPLLLEFKKMLREELNLNFLYIRSPKKGNSWLYITFLTLEDQKKALATLKRYTWKGRTIIGTLVVADLKRKTDDQNGTLESKKAKYDIPIEEQMLMSTIPYHSISYDEQLSKKNEETVSLLKWLNLLTEKRNHLLSGWFDEQAAKNENKLPFALEDVRPSPIIDGYRNKCEFRIGKNRETNAVTVGYRVDNQQDGSLDVALPDSLRHLPKQMIQVAKEFEKFIQQSGMSVNENDNDGIGILKIMTVRMNKAGQIMLIITIRHNELPEEELNKLKTDLINFFTVGDGHECNVVSLYLFVEKEKDVGEHKKIVPVEEHIWGSKYLEEDVLGLKLEVTPDFYFQCNTYSAEVLYKAVAELAAVDSETTVLDLCCGSGGMGMVLAKQAKEVLGVELMDTNVEGAKKLSLKNGLENCEFVQGKIDDVYPSLLEKLKGKKVVPILDPPRAGISQSMIVNLRKLEEASKLIYVCSNHKLPLKNLLDLATVESMFADTNPFVPTKVIPIDVSPHTLRCELVILCERLDMKTLPKPTREPKKAQSNINRRKRRYPSRNSYWSKRRGNNSGGNRKRGSGYQQSSRDSSYQQGRKLPPLMGYNYNKGSNFNKRGNYPSMSARDSLYPPPLRDALYNTPPSWSYGNQNYSDYRRPYQSQIGSYGNNYFDSGRNWDYNRGPDGYYNDTYDYETRYSNFRRDVEAAINSSYRNPPSRSGPRPLMRGSGGKNRGRKGRR